MPTPTFASSRSFDLMVFRTRTTQLLIVLGLLALSTGSALPGTLGGLGGLSGGMPWEGPLNQILDSLTGPVARVIGAVAIISTGLGVAFGEGGPMLRKLLWVVLGLSLAFSALTFGLPLLGFAGGLLV